MSSVRNEPTPPEIAADKISQAAKKEYIRLSKEQAKAIKKEFLNLLAELLQNEKRLESSLLKHVHKTLISGVKKEKAESKAAIKLAISNVKKYSPNFSKDHIHIDELIECCKPLVRNQFSFRFLDKFYSHNTIYVPPSADILADMRSLIQSRYEKNNKSHDILSKKLRAVMALRDLSSTYYHFGSDLKKNIDFIMKKDKEAFDALTNRRGNSKFWKFIDTILTKLKKSPSTLGIKSALFQKKVDRSLQTMTKQELPKLKK